MRLLDRLVTRTASEPARAPEIIVSTGLSSWRQSVLVVAYGPIGGDEPLAAALPIGWRLTRVASHAASELLVVVAADGGSGVARVRRAHPSDPLLAIVPLMADSSVVVDALDAGADACIRTAGATVVASYLIAMQRRRELERVSDLTRT
jgi:hypothetical protein